MINKIKPVKTLPCWCSIGACILTATITWGAEPPAPQHYKKNCIACHARMTGGDGSVLYGNKNGLIHDLQSLNQRVSYCRKSLDLQWSKFEEMQVVDYLNQRFYHFKQPTRSNHGEG